MNDVRAEQGMTPATGLHGIHASEECVEGRCRWPDEGPGGGRNLFEIDALRLLVTVAETGSFTRAAVRLN